MLQAIIANGIASFVMAIQLLYPTGSIRVTHRDEMPRKSSNMMKVYNLQAMPLVEKRMGPICSIEI